MEHKTGKRIPLSRGWKTLRNLVLLVVALGLCWGLTRVPLWLAQRALEVGAEQQGAEETELLWRGNLPVLFEGGAEPPLPGRTPCRWCWREAARPCGAATWTAMRETYF